MKFNRMASLALITSMLLSSVSAFAAWFPDHDLEGSKDDPLLTRYPGSMIIAYLKRPFDETDLIAGAYKDAGAGKLPYPTIHVEGAITRLVYLFAPDRSAVDVMRNYADALRKANMSIMFSCDKSACGGDALHNFSGSFPDAKLSVQLENWNDIGQSNPFIDLSNQSRYILAKGSGADGTITYIAVYVIPPSDGNGGIFVEIAKPAPLQSGQVSANLSAADMAKSITAEGRVALYGLQFDTDKTELRADSKPSLAEIAKLLTQDPKLNVFVVGHTDNQGAYAHNVELSQKRSDAIVQALTSQFKIAPARLIAKGIGSLAPVASNDNDAGRAKNRRVELVKQ